uniref:AlNc14C119G6605 protein n=1 Tax=Albugo laibachii Nc14 TaxID=890382 RepID=F0WJ73_9STRA|nr:AlNc14C119G6605 [Albugo laibachii Nc14]|eukprot:CCA21320.1 AlNc14C119G6605 [Albugo laibachii Nc14]
MLYFKNTASTKRWFSNPVKAPRRTATAKKAGTQSILVGMPGSPPRKKRPISASSHVITRLLYPREVKGLNSALWYRKFGAEAFT